MVIVYFEENCLFAFLQRDEKTQVLSSHGHEVLVRGFSFLFFFTFDRARLTSIINYSCLLLSNWLHPYKTPSHLTLTRKQNMFPKTSSYSCKGKIISTVYAVG